jgi:hypothetical protein
VVAYSGKSNSLQSDGGYTAVGNLGVNPRFGGVCATSVNSKNGCVCPCDGRVP